MFLNVLVFRLPRESPLQSCRVQPEHSAGRRNLNIHLNIHRNILSTLPTALLLLLLLLSLTIFGSSDHLRLVASPLVHHLRR